MTLNPKRRSKARDRSITIKQLARAVDAAGLELDVKLDPKPFKLNEMPPPVEHNAIRPSYYKTGGIEAIDVIEAWGLGFCLGTVVKYVARAGRKDPTKTVEDLKKAAWYLQHEIERLEKLKP